MTTIDAPMRKAISRAVEAYHTAKELADEAGIDNSALGKYRSGVAPTMEDDTWAKLYPFAKPYLPPDPKYIPREELLKLVESRSTPAERPAPTLPPAIPPVLMQLCQNWDALPQSARSAVLAVATMALSAVATGGK